MMALVHCRSALRRSHLSRELMPGSLRFLPPSIKTYPCLRANRILPSIQRLTPVHLRQHSPTTSHASTGGSPSRPASVFEELPYTPDNSPRRLIVRQHHPSPHPG